VLLITMLGWLGLMLAMSSDQSLLLEGGATPWLYLLYALGVLALLGVVPAVIHGVRCWMAPRRGRWVLLGETLLVLAVIYMAWLLLALRMVSFNVRY
jgi:hypothetical protein